MDQTMLEQLCRIRDMRLCGGVAILPMVHGSAPSVADIMGSRNYLERMN